AAESTGRFRRLAANADAGIPRGDVHRSDGPESAHAARGTAESQRARDASPWPADADRAHAWDRPAPHAADGSADGIPPVARPGVRNLRRSSAMSSGGTDDSQAQDGRVSALFAKEKPKDGTPAQPGHFQVARSRREARAGGAVLQAGVAGAAPL